MLQVGLGGVGDEVRGDVGCRDVPEACGRLAAGEACVFAGGHTTPCVHGLGERKRAERDEAGELHGGV